MALTNETNNALLKKYYASEENVILTIKDSTANPSANSGYSEYEFTINGITQFKISVYLNSDKTFTIHTKPLLSAQLETEINFTYESSNILNLKKFGLKKGYDTIQLGEFLVAQQFQENGKYIGSYILFENCPVVVFNGYPQSVSFLVETRYGLSLFNERIDPTDNFHLIRGFIGRQCNEEGIYLRWKNPFGGWSYWLFDYIKEETITTKSKGVILNRLSENNGVHSTIKHLGYTVKKQWKLKSAIPIIGDEIKILQGLLQSNQIHLFKGKKGDDYSKENSFGAWEQVYISDGNTKKIIDKQNVFDFETTIIFN